MVHGETLLKSTNHRESVRSLVNSVAVRSGRWFSVGGVRTRKLVAESSFRDRRCVPGCLSRVDVRRFEAGGWLLWARDPSRIRDAGTRGGDAKRSGGEGRRVGTDARHRKLKEVASDDAEVPSSRMQGDVDSLSLLLPACTHYPTLPCTSLPFSPTPLSVSFHCSSVLSTLPFLFSSLLFSSHLRHAAGFHLCFAAFSCYSFPLSLFFLFVFFLSATCSSRFLSEFLPPLFHSPSFPTGLSSRRLRSISLTRPRCLHRAISFSSSLSQFYEYLHRVLSANIFESSRIRFSIFHFICTGYQCTVDRL